MDDDITFSPSITYKDPKRATEWLTEAFGFELTMAIESGDGDPSQSHYEMAAANGRGRLMIGGQWADWTRSPKDTGGFVNATVHVSVASDLDVHCERARSAGATIVVEPNEQFYGDRVYRCKDPEGHHWVFAMHVRDVSVEEASAAIGAEIFATKW